MCPSCGYSLEALPPEGRCPECGTEYDQSVVVLHGWGRDVATARPAVAALFVALTALFAWDALRDGRRDPIGLVIGFALVLWVVTSLWRRWGNTMPGLAQVRLSAEGIHQLDAATAAAAGSEFTPWKELRDVTVEPRGDDHARIVALRVPRFWRPGDTVVSVIVKCTPKQADALRARVAAWRAAADGNAPV